MMHACQVGSAEEADVVFVMASMSVANNSLHATFMDEAEALLPHLREKPHVIILNHGIQATPNPKPLAPSSRRSTHTVTSSMVACVAASWDHIRKVLSS